MVKGYESECEICKILANSNRLKILTILKDKSLMVNEIAKKTNLPQSVVSQHLSMMKHLGILKTKKNGNFVNYKIIYPEILDSFEIIEKIREKIKLN